MLYAKLIVLILIFKIDTLGAIKTASLKIGNGAELKMENILTEFMTDLKKFSYDDLNYPRLIVFGKKAIFLQATKVLLEIGTPYFISTESEATVLPSQFGSESVVLIFIDGHSDSEMNSAFSKLPKDHLCKTLIISMEDNRTEHSIGAIISAAGKMNLKNVMLASFDGEVMKIYGQRLDPSCERNITLMNTWVPKKGFQGDEKIIQHRIPRMNSHGCPKIVSTLALTPTMMLQKDGNMSLHIKGGLEGYLVKTIAEYLNMVLVVKLPPVEEKFLLLPDGTVAGIIGEVARDEATFGIGQIRPTLERAAVVDLTTTYNHECMVWTLPLITKYEYSIIGSEFSTTAWIMVILSILICCGLVYAVPRLNLGYRTSVNVFDVIAMTFNYAIPRHPYGVLGKIFFLVYLHYSRIISTAYSASLSSILTTTTPQPTIHDIDGFIAAGLRTAGTVTSRDMLADIILLNNRSTEVIDRYEVITSLDEALARIIDRRDIAYFRHRSSIEYAAKKALMAGKSAKFYSLPACVISYNSVMVTPKGSRITAQVNDIILRLREAGFYDHWLNQDYRSGLGIMELKFNSHSLARLKSIFVLYLCCLIPAFLAFAAELIAFKLQLNWFTR